MGMKIGVHQSNNSGFLKRALVSLTLGPLALYLIYLGGIVYFLALAIVLSIATMEYTQIMREMGWDASLVVLLPPVWLMWLAAQWGGSTLFSGAVMLGLLLVMLHALWLYERGRSAQTAVTWFSMIGGVVLLGWLGSHFFHIRQLPQLAWQWTMIAILGTWIADSAAYLVGKFMAGRFLLGRHQMAPRLSPNKTIEGYLGGLVITTIVLLLLSGLLQIKLVWVVAVAILVAGVAPLGDLSISLIKRVAGVKDSGHLLPGHGGALDRIDSLVWSVTLVYYLALFVQTLPG